MVDAGLAISARVDRRFALVDVFTALGAVGAERNLISELAVSISVETRVANTVVTIFHRNVGNTSSVVVTHVTSANRTWVGETHPPGVSIVTHLISVAVVGIASALVAVFANGNVAHSNTCLEDIATVCACSTRVGWHAVGDALVGGVRVNAIGARRANLRREAFVDIGAPSGTCGLINGAREPLRGG